MFKNQFKFDNKEFNTKASLALYLKNNFRKSLKIIDDGSLLQFLNEETPDLYSKIVELSKEYESLENILTLIIYMLDNSCGINTPQYHFKSNYDISDVMKKKYPNIDPDIKRLFSDKVLAHIFWNEFLKTSDPRFKRNYTFMLHVYENRMYDFTYYYYLYLHLDKNETIRFTLDGVKMKSLVEITNHLVINIDRSSLIIDEILRNPFILALIAINSGIDIVAGILIGKRKLEILKCLQSYANVDLTPIIKRKMCYWLLMNYQNYNYQTDNAKSLEAEYAKINRTLSLSSISDFVEIYDKCVELYHSFLELFNHNRIVEFKTGISSAEDYYLNYRFNDEYVCKQFLVDNDLFDPVIHTKIHNDTVDRLEIEKNDLKQFKDEVLSLTDGHKFNVRKLRSNLFISLTYFLFLAFSLFAGLYYYKNVYVSKFDVVVYDSLIILGSISVVLAFLCIVKYRRKLKNAKTIRDAIKESDANLKEIEKEEEQTLSVNAKCSHNILCNLTYYEKRRKTTLNKVKKISCKKTTVCELFIIMMVVLAVLPIVEFGLSYTLYLLKVEPFHIYFNHIKLNIISLGMVVLNITLLTIFRRKKVVYYLLYFYIALLVVLSYLL